MTVITRFAPSPTWYLHIGSLRTILYNYLYAKKNNWMILLRIEDTDRSRFIEGSVENLINVLGCVWIIPDEWPNKQWDRWPYYQSERLEIYKKYIDELIEKDKAYYCFCSSERLTELREEQISLWLATKYDKTCRFLDKNEIEDNLKAWLPYVVRLKVPENEKIEFIDTIKWKVIVNSKDIDEQILMKSDGFPTYHLANVVDDHLMWITDVIRWDEWTPSTPKHIIIYNAFSWKIPKFSHIPLILWKDKKKLSKRTWDVAVELYLAKWYLTEALINYIALLWWNPKTTEEFFTMWELIKKFDLNNVHKSWAIFDIDRLNFFNSYYLKNASIDYVFYEYICFLKTYDNDFLKKITTFPEKYNKNILNELKTRIKKFDEVKKLTIFFYNEPRIPALEIMINEKMKITDINVVKKWLDLTIDILNSISEDFETIDEVKILFIEKIKEANMKNWQVLWPVRVALSWEEFSPWALELIFILWLDECLKRINKVIKNIF